MQRDADTLFPNVNKEFIKSALKSEVRLDGRSPYDGRDVKMEFAPDDSSVTVRFGKTKVLVTIDARIEEPRSRQSEGRLNCVVRFSPMASTAFDSSNRMDYAATSIVNLMSKVFGDGAAIDLEALTIQRGRKAWTLYLDAHVLDHDGNLPDACMFGAIAALSAVRLPQTEVSTEGVLVVHSKDDREPLGLTIQHVPFACSFALFEDGDVIALDPTLEEEAAAAGLVTVVANAHDELCGVSKTEGRGLRSAQLLRCVRITLRRAAELGRLLYDALETHKLSRVMARVRRAGGEVAGGTTAANFERVAAAQAAAAPAAAAVATVPGAIIEAPLGPMPSGELPKVQLLSIGEATASGAAEARTSGAAPMASTSAAAAPADADDDDGAAAEEGADDAMEAEPQPAARGTLADADTPRKKKKKKKKKRPDDAQPEHEADVGRTSSGRGVKRPGVPATPVDADPEFDEFAAIAELIAGGRSATGAPPSLQDSAKKAKKSSKKGSKAKQ